MSNVDHELVRVYREQGYSLSETMVEMLNEHYSHQTERRGCGYTQATRVISESVNVPRYPDEYKDLRVFQDVDSKALKQVISQAVHQGVDIQSWRNLDQNPSVLAYMATHQDEYAQALKLQVEWQSKLRQLSSLVELEESKVLANLIEDIILPKTETETGYIELNALSDKPKVGSCPMAEKFFFKIAHDQVLRRGEINIFVDQQQRPVLMEKLNMGDNHSCISLQPVLINGVRLPAGSLFSVNYDAEEVVNKRSNKGYSGFVAPVQNIPGFYFLRLTTLAISSQNRRRAFSSHFEQQVQNGLYSPETTQLSQILQVAQAQ
jgi:hypothetical protein